METAVDDKIAKLSFTDADFDIKYLNILNWLHYEVDTADLKNELVKYASTVGRGEIANQIPLTQITVEAKIAYCLNHGANLSDDKKNRVINYLDNYTHSQSDLTSSWETIPETAKGKVINSYVSCYSLIDNAKTRVLNGKLNPRDLAAEIRKIISDKGSNKDAIVKMLLQHYKESLTDARSHDSTKLWVSPLTTIVETIGFMLGNHNSVKTGARRAKARKMAGVENYDRKGEKAASKVSYKGEDAALGIRSIDPTNLVGAAAAVVFNTKTRHCEVYIAKSGLTLSVQGAKITNFDEKTSIGKTMRKPEADLPHWSRASNIRRLEVLLKNFSGKGWELTGKLNKNCVIVKVL